MSLAPPPTEHAMPEPATRPADRQPEAGVPGRTQTPEKRKSSPSRNGFPTPWRLDVAGYMHLSDAGLLPPNTELFHGEVVTMSAQGNAHSVCLTDLFVKLLAIFPPPAWFIRVQATHRFSEQLAYEPDLCLLRGRPIEGAIVDEVPTLVVEISQTTQPYDLGPKRLDYARLGVPEYWVVDLPRKRVRVFRSPNPAAMDAENAYAVELAAEFDGRVACLAAPESFIPVAEFVPNVG